MSAEFPQSFYMTVTRMDNGKWMMSLQVVNIDSEDHASRLVDATKRWLTAEGGWSKSGRSKEARR